MVYNNKGSPDYNVIEESCRFVSKYYPKFPNLKSQPEWWSGG